MSTRAGEDRVGVAVRLGAYLVVLALLLAAGAALGAVVGPLDGDGPAAEPPTVDEPADEDVHGEGR